MGNIALAETFLSFEFLPTLRRRDRSNFKLIYSLGDRSINVLRNAILKEYRCK
jgi:hypothetical protein